ncbi:MAG TPA: hypothetical protein VHG91_02550 [Longimicrobium sp.]|nr:hypothetical protein [Longimicrobium sp.]
MPRLRPFASALAALALLVSWTVGAWAAPCPEVAAPSAVEMAMEHGGAHHPGGHAAHHSETPAPAPADDGRAPVPDAPECPMLAVGGTCAGPLLAPAESAVAAPSAARVTGYVAAPGVRDRLPSDALLRPPELG